MKKFDFAHMLARRRFTVQRWLESEQIGTWKSFKGWMKQNEAGYSFSEVFVSEAKGILQAPSKAPEPSRNEQSTPESLPVKDVLVELVQPSEELAPGPKSTKKKQVGLDSPKEE